MDFWKSLEFLESLDFESKTGNFRAKGCLAAGRRFPIIGHNTAGVSTAFLVARATDKLSGVKELAMAGGHLSAPPRLVSRPLPSIIFSIQLRAPPVSLLRLALLCAASVNALPQLMAEPTGPPNDPASDELLSTVRASLPMCACPWGVSSLLLCGCVLRARRIASPEVVSAKQSSGENG